VKDYMTMAIARYLAQCGIEDAQVVASGIMELPCIHRCLTCYEIVIRLIDKTRIACGL
jgi:hypothetical protein